MTLLIRCWRFTKLGCVENILLLLLLWNRRTPQPMADPTREKIKSKVAFWPLFSSKVAFWPLFLPQQIIFRGLRLILSREQTTRNPTQPNWKQTKQTNIVFERAPDSLARTTLETRILSQLDTGGGYDLRERRARPSRPIINQPLLKKPDLKKRIGYM